MTASAFTFELHFSEEIEISFATLRDDVIDVTGGDGNKGAALADRQQPELGDHHRPSVGRSRVHRPADDDRLRGRWCRMYGRWPNVVEQVNGDGIRPRRF